MKDLNAGLFQVVTPGTIFFFQTVGNATKTAQQLSKLPAQRTSLGPCSEPLPWLPAQVRVWSWVLNDSADNTRNTRKQLLF